MPRLTKTFVESVEFDGKQRIVFDTELRGFGLRVGKDSKVFIVQKDIAGRTRRATIGGYPTFSVDMARREARQLLAAMAKGIDPVVEKRTARERGVTVGAALQAMLLHLKRHKRSDRTISDYRRKLDKYLSGWMSRPIGEIDKHAVRKRHQEIVDEIRAGIYAEITSLRGTYSRTRRANEDGTRSSDDVFRIFRGLYNFAHDNFAGIPPENPCDRLQWFTRLTDRRETIIPGDKLADWYSDVMVYPNPIKRDYLLIVLLTGLRRTNALELEWANVDIESKRLHIPKPKSGRKFDLPLSTQLIEIFKRVREVGQQLYPGTPWVFPADSKSGHLVDPRMENKTVEHCIHDLRRVFVSQAERVCPKHYVSLLVNHQTDANITSRYWISEWDTLADYMQKISDRLMGLCRNETN